MDTKKIYIRSDIHTERHTYGATYIRRKHAHERDILTEQHIHVKRIHLETRRGHAHGGNIHTTYCPIPQVVPAPEVGDQFSRRPNFSLSAFQSLITTRIYQPSSGLCGGVELV